MNRGVCLICGKYLDFCGGRLLVFLSKKGLTSHVRARKARKDGKAEMISDMVAAIVHTSCRKDRRAQNCQIHQENSKSFNSFISAVVFAANFRCLCLSFPSCVPACFRVAWEFSHKDPLNRDGKVQKFHWYQSHAPHPPPAPENLLIGIMQLQIRLRKQI